MVTQNLVSNANARTIASLGDVEVIQYDKDLSVNPLESKMEYFAAKMNVNRRQVLIHLNGKKYMLQAGAMQWMAGDVTMESGVKGAKDFLGKMLSSAVTNESAVKPEYTGTGDLMLEPTYRHILLTRVEDWGGSIVLDDGLFLACEGTLQHKVVARSNVSSALLGGEGLFNLSLNGSGVAVFESVVPKEELIEITLENDVLKIDGNMAIAWSGSLEFTVEKSTKSFLGSAMSGEGFVNVYRGTGKVWLAPVIATSLPAGLASSEENTSAQTGSAPAANEVSGSASSALKMLGKFL